MDQHAGSNTVEAAAAQAADQSFPKLKDALDLMRRQAERGARTRCPKPLRQLVVAVLDSGISAYDLCRMTGLSRQSVNRWYKELSKEQPVPLTTLLRQIGAEIKGQATASLPMQRVVKFRIGPTVTMEVSSEDVTTDLLKKLSELGKAG